MVFEQNAEIGGKVIKFNTGYLAKQADGAVVVSMGDTMVFASAVVSEQAKEGQDFFPLTVDYRDKYYAAGRMPGGFIKREGRPGDVEILVSRLTDRPLRPLFPGDFINEVQVIIFPISADKENNPDILAINAASAALAISRIPFHGPVGAVRVGKIDGKLIINPTYEESDKSVLDLVVAGTKKAVTMIEGSAHNLSEAEMLEAVNFAHDHIKQICDVQEKLAAECGKPKMTYKPFQSDENLKREFTEKYFSSIENLKSILEKKAREVAFNGIVEKAKEELAEKYPDSLGQIRSIADDIDGQIVRRRILEESARADGRALKEIRPIDIQMGLLPRVHGAAVFTRGQTQSLGILTLAPMADAQRVDSIMGESKKRFILHYNFPPFSVGECGKTGGTGRREIGHGMLAERALEYVLPEESKFPYSIRLVSEILESNGSSSMATVCSGSLALFNGGVPVKSAVAGIAMGLVMEGDRYAVLSDIQGIEDHLGDMDFKVAGTESGITAFQLDIKIEGITSEIMRVALDQAKEGRLHILGKMNEKAAAPSEQLSEYAPRIETIIIPSDKIGDLIGPGGKTIRSLTESTNTSIDIAQDGSVVIAALDKKCLDDAVRKINAIVRDVEIGAIYTGKVIKIMEYGAFIELLPGKEGLLHISKIDHKKVMKVTDVLKEGQTLDVKVIGIDKMGRIDLSRKDLLPKEE